MSRWRRLFGSDEFTRICCGVCLWTIEHEGGEPQLQGVGVGRLVVTRGGLGEAGVCQQLGQVAVRPGPDRAPKPETSRLS